MTLDELIRRAVDHVGLGDPISREVVARIVTNAYIAGMREAAAAINRRAVILAAEEYLVDAEVLLVMKKLLTDAADDLERDE